MEGDIILANKVVRLHWQIRLTGYPPGLPCVRRTLQSSPLDSSGEVANHRIEPHIDPLILVAFKWNWYAPIQVAGDSARAQTFLKPVHRKGQDIGTPVIFFLRQPLHKGLLQLWQIQEKVVGWPDLQLALLASTEAAARINQVYRIKHMAAVVTLITTSCRVATVWACSLDKAIGEKASVRWTIGR